MAKFTYTERELDLSVQLYKASLEFFINVNDYNLYSIYNGKQDYPAMVRPLCDLGFDAIDGLREIIAYRCQILGEEGRAKLKEYIHLLQWRWHSIYGLADVRQAYATTEFAKPRKFIQPLTLYQTMLLDSIDAIMETLAEELYDPNLYVNDIIQRHLDRLRHFADVTETRHYGKSS